MRLQRRQRRASERSLAALVRFLLGEYIEKQEGGDRG
jgi:hypothetical protein